MPRSNVPADTGNQATVSFAEGITATLKVRSIDPSEESVGDIDVSVLATSGEKVTIPEDTYDAVEYTLEWLWDTFDDPPVLGQPLGLTTITHPLRPDELTPATRAGSARVSAVKHPTMRNNEPQVGTLKIKMDGVTPTAYTKST